MSHAEPRPGRSHCGVVYDNDCLAPPGFGNAGGWADLPGVRRTDLHTCHECGDAVCHTCATKRGRHWICRSHIEESP